MNWKLFFLTLALCSLAPLSWAQDATAETITPKKMVVIYGDSITAGAFLKSNAQRWASLVGAQSQGNLEIANEGKGGRPTDSLGEFEAMLKRQPRVDLLVIALGANDARDISGQCVPKAAKNIQTMIGRARENYGVKLPILLVGPTNINKDALGPTKPIGPQREANLVALNTAYTDLAKAQNCAFVSTYGVVPETSLKADGVHPDAEGHVAIAKVMLPAIASAAGVTLPNQ